MPRNCWISLSFANLVYLAAWADLLPPGRLDAFLRKTLAGYSLYFAVAADVFVLSLATFLIVSIAPRLPGWLQRFLTILAIAAVALAVRTLSIHWPFYTRALGPAIAAALAVFVLGSFSKSIRLLAGIAMAATPCLAVTLIGSLVYLNTQTPLPPDPQLAQRLAGRPPVRVLWILFDDWDERLTFADRPAGIQLPTVDALAARSLNATRVLAVQAGRTRVEDMSTVAASPELLYGKFIEQEGVRDAATMEMQFASRREGLFDAREPVVFGEGDEIFARMRARGWNAAAAGWYLPYCRVFGSQLVDCYWDVRYIRAYNVSRNFAHAALDETRMLFETDAFSPFGPSLLDTRHKQEYDALMAAGRRYAADPSLGLAFIHLNVPHAPYFYDPKIGPSLRYTIWKSLYNEGLEWVDRSLADILTSLHQSGLEDRTAVLATSDHPFRFSEAQDPHVPYLVHFPGEQDGLLWNEEVSAIRTPDLVMAIASGEVKSAREAAEFLAFRGTRSESRP